MVHLSLLSRLFTRQRVPATPRNIRTDDDIRDDIRADRIRIRTDICNRNEDPIF